MTWPLNDLVMQERRSIGALLVHGEGGYYNIVSILLGLPIYIQSAQQLRAFGVDKMQ